TCKSGVKRPSHEIYNAWYRFRSVEEADRCDAGRPGSRNILSGRACDAADGNDWEGHAGTDLVQHLQTSNPMAFRLVAGGKNGTEEQVIASAFLFRGHGLVKIVNGPSDQEFTSDGRTDARGGIGGAAQVDAISVRLQRNVEAIVNHNPRRRSLRNVARLPREFKQRTGRQKRLADLDKSDTNVGGRAYPCHGAHGIPSRIGDDADDRGFHVRVRDSRFAVRDSSVMRDPGCGIRHAVTHAKIRGFRTNTIRD